VTVTGAGISTNAGIPVRIPASLPVLLSLDLGFSIKNSVYSLGHRRIFHSSVLSDPEKRALFCREITKMRQIVKHANPTKIHRLILGLCDAGKLVRDYTQNIDFLEEKAGLSTDLQKGPGSRSHFRRKYRARRVRSHHGAKLEPRRDNSRGVECVLLHGSLRRLRCFSCLGTHSWDGCG